MKNYQSRSLDGLSVFLDKLVCEYSEECVGEADACAYVYFLTVTNFSDRAVRLLGRKWVLVGESGVEVIEGGKVVSQTPTLNPGESFSYNSFHVVRERTIASGVLYGIDEYDEAVHIVIPGFEMSMPDRGDSKKKDEIRRSQ